MSNDGLSPEDVLALEVEKLKLQELTLKAIELCAQIQEDVEALAASLDQEQD